MANFESKSITIILMQIVGPALIMMMVGSLVFFLIEVAYRGPHTMRMYWVMGLFTFASVLVSRISIEEGRDRAILLGFPLALATFLATNRLIAFQYPTLAVFGPILILSLIGVVMWSSAKLTWDCTLIDRSRDPSSTGLLDRIGRRPDEPESVDYCDGSESTTTTRNPGWLRMLFGSGRSNTPGVWILYFAMLAVGVFGLGQWLVPADRRSQGFLLFASYLGSTLCLLMTTSLLGLQRYLKQRNLSVPDPIARNWLITGTAFAMLVVLSVLLIPRPAASSRFQDWLAVLVQSPNQQVSRIAPGRDGRDDQTEVQPKKQRVDEDSQQPADARQPKRENEVGGDGSTSDQKHGNQQNSDHSDGSDVQDAADQPQSVEQVQSEHAESDSKAQRSEPERPTDAHRKPDRAQQADQQPQQRSDNRPQDNQPPPENRPPAENQAHSDNDMVRQGLQRASESIQTLFRIAASIALLLMAWFFRSELAKLFSLFFRKKTQARLEEAPSDSVAAASPSKPFSSFSDPFADGRAANMTVPQITVYTWLALDAWARDAGFSRPPDMTAAEFACGLAKVDQPIGSMAGDLAELYGRCLYGRDAVSRTDAHSLVKLWRRMTATAGRRVRQGTLTRETFLGPSSP